MKITIEPETDEEKLNPQVKRVVMADMAAVALVGISAEHPEKTPIYFHAPSLPALQQRMFELEYQLTKARFITEATQAQQAPRIQVPRTNIPFPGPNNRRIGQ